MSAARPAHRTKHITIGRIFFCLVVIAFLSRALIAPGYMPGHETSAKLSFLTFCSGAGNAEPDVSLINLVNHTRHTPQGRHDGQICPFCVVAAQAAIPLQPTLSVAASTAGYLVFLVRETLATWHSPRLGSPVGSRAPPSTLA